MDVNMFFEEIMQESVPNLSVFLLFLIQNLLTTVKCETTKDIKKCIAGK